MSLDITLLFNIVLAALSFLGGWLFTRVFSISDRQEKIIKDLNDKTFSDFISLRKEVEIESRKHQQDISDLALKVSTTYVTKEAFETYLNRIESKLDRNFDILQGFLGKNNKN